VGGGWDDGLWWNLVEWGYGFGQGISIKKEGNAKDNKTFFHHIEKGVKPSVGGVSGQCSTRSGARNCVRSYIRYRICVEITTESSVLDGAGGKGNISLGVVLVSARKKYGLVGGGRC